MYKNPIDDCIASGDYHVERIRCPECNYVQQAEVEHTKPWWCYIHTCRNCNYIIMESEWNCIDDRITRPKLPFMKNFTITELILRVPIICVAIVVLAEFIIHIESNWINFMLFLLGAASWEGILMIGQRMKWWNLVDYWNNKENK